jgi:hypothetical protein
VKPQRSSDRLLHYAERFDENAGVSERLRQNDQIAGVVKTVLREIPVRPEYSTFGVSSCLAQITPARRAPSAKRPACTAYSRNHPVSGMNRRYSGPCRYHLTYGFMAQDHIRGSGRRIAKPEPGKLAIRAAHAYLPDPKENFVVAGDRRVGDLAFPDFA